MAEGVTCVEWPLLAWNAKVLFQKLPVQSPIFEIKDMSCHLYFDDNTDRRNGKEYYELILKGRSARSPEFIAFDSKTHILDMRQDIRFAKDNVVRRLEKSFEYCIWREEKYKILEQRYSMVGDCNWLQFICTFGPAKENPPFKKTELELRDNFKVETTLDNLSSDYIGLLDSGYMSDLIILCQDTNVKAHKVLLSIRSKTFKEKLENDEDGVLDMSDIIYSDLHPILCYIYSGKLPELNEDNMYGLYELSHKFQLKSLKSGIANFLISEMKIKNSLRHLNYAQKCNDSGLKLVLASFITFARRFVPPDRWRLIHEQFRTVTTWNLDNEEFVRKLPMISLDRTL